MAIRVLHVVTSMDAGGIETMLMNLYRNIDRSQVQFDFLVHRSHKGFYDDEIVAMGGSIYRLMPIRLTTLSKYIKSLAEFFDQNAYVIVHSHISVMSYLVLKMAKRKKVPIRIAHSHEAHKSIRDHKVLRVPIILFSKQFINGYTTHRLACSQEAGRWLFGDKADFRVLNNAIDAKRFMFEKDRRQQKRNELKIDGKFVIGHVGNFSRAKNYPFILEVFGSIRKKNSNAILLLVGRDENNPAIRDRVQELGLEDSVVFTGVRTDVADILQAMDVFLFPSLMEGLPVTLIEAQASGLPCIVADTITEEVKITDLVDFVSLDKSAEFWADKVLHYANASERQNTYAMISAAGYDIKENAKWLQEFYLAEYEKALANHM